MPQVANGGAKQLSSYKFTDTVPMSVAAQQSAHSSWDAIAHTLVAQIKGSRSKISPSKLITNEQLQHCWQLLQHLLHPPSSQTPASLPSLAQQHLQCHVRHTEARRSEALEGRPPAGPRRSLDGHGRTSLDSDRRSYGSEDEEGWEEVRDESDDMDDVVDDSTKGGHMSGGDLIAMSVDPLYHYSASKCSRAAALGLQRYLKVSHCSFQCPERRLLGTNHRG